MYSAFALALKDVLREALRNTGPFFTDVEIIDVKIEGDPSDEFLVVQLTIAEHPGHLFHLRTRVRDYQENDPDPSRWRGYLFDRVMETVDAAPGLSPSIDSENSTTIEF